MSACKIYRVFYKHKNSMSDRVYSVTVPVIGTVTPELIEYHWRMSQANVPHTIFIGAELEIHA